MTAVSDTSILVMVGCLVKDYGEELVATGAAFIFSLTSACYKLIFSYSALFCRTLLLLFLP